MVVGVVLLVVPVPAYLLVRWHKRKTKEAAALQAAEAEAARQRMQSRMMRPGSKSFSLKPGASGGSTADIMVRSGSVGGLAGYHNNGRLQSWSGSPDRTYGQLSISRQASVTSMGSALPVRSGAGARGWRRGASLRSGTACLPAQPCRSAHTCRPVLPPPRPPKPPLQSSRSFGHMRTPSLPGGGRAPYASPLPVPAGAYEEELEAARTARSERG